MKEIPQAEILRWARPRTQPAAVVRFLRSIGIKAEKKPNGEILVFEEWVTQAGLPEAAKHEPEWAPDFSKLSKICQ